MSLFFSASVHPTSAVGVGVMSTRTTAFGCQKRSFIHPATFGQEPITSLVQSTKKRNSQLRARTECPPLRAHSFGLRTKTEIRSETWTVSLSGAGRDGPIGAVAKEDLEIIQTHIDELWENLISGLGEFLKGYPLAQGCGWEPPPRGQLKWKWHAALGRRRKRN